MKATKFLIIFGLIFFTVGAGLLTGGFFAFKSTSRFIETAHQSQGRVVALERRESTNSEGRRSVSYYPRVEFTPRRGNKTVFTSSSGSSPPSYNVGDKVEILYDPQNPSKAKINAFFAKWGGSLILTIMGSIFSLVGGFIMFFSIKTARGRIWAKKYGREVKAEVIFVGYDRSYTVNGKNPWMVKCEWKDNLTDRLHTFESEGVWENLSAHIEVGDEIRVKVNMRNPKQHWVDVSNPTIRAAA